LPFSTQQDNGIECHMPRECAFCFDTATTGEHLWSGWVGKLIGEKRRFSVKREMKGKVHQWKSVGLNEKALVLCESCNNVWGSQLETRMKLIIRDAVFDGTAMELARKDIATIVAFSIMKSFVCDHMDEDTKSFYDRSERHSFRRDFTLPGGVQIWLANTTLDHGVYKAGYLKMPLNNPNRFEGYIFTVSLGRFVIQSVAARWSKKSRRRHAAAPRLPQSLLWSGCLIPIWPDCNLPVFWPSPKQLGSQDLDALVDRFRNMKVEI
jgi:hypothetical protein